MAQHNMFLTDNTGQHNLNSMINATNDYIKILDYTPGTPDENLTWGGSDKFYGDPLQESRYKNVVESARLLVAKPSRDLFRAWLQTMESFFVRAKTYAQRRVGYPGYVEHSPEGGGEVPYRSQILSGRVDLAPGTMGIGWRNNVFEVVMTWTRRFYWEGESKFVHVLRPGGTPNNGFQTFYNHKDSTHWNYVELTNDASGATWIEGVLPTPLKIEITNNSGVAYGEQYLAVWNGFPDPATFDGTIEIEGTPGTTQQPGVANTGLYSSGFYGVPAQANANVETIVFTVTVPTASLQAMRGRSFRVFLRVLNGSEFVTGTRYRLAMLQANEYVWFGPYMQTQDNPLGAGSDWNEFVDFGIARFPPAAISEWGAGTIAPLKLEFRVIPPANKTYSADFVQILPTDSIKRYFHTNVTGIADTWKILDDGPANTLYLDVTGEGLTKQIRAIGGPLVAFPQENNRLYWLAMQPNGTGNPLLTASIRVSYRPRRLTL